MNKTISKRNLAAHLARRAGFGVNPELLDRYETVKYVDLVEQFLRYEDSQHMSDDLIFRRFPNMHAQLTHNAMHWALRMLTTDNELKDKIALFWHGIFATGEGKLNNFGASTNQIDTFRRHGSGTFDNLLLELSKDPAMLIWLDNQTNHKSETNENYGREILELFSMGVGNYSELDIKECSRAFTGWTVKNAEYMALMANKDSIWPYGRIFWHFEYREDDHDPGKKMFLGKEGNLNGDDVIEIICQQEATARFVSRHLYNFFVADEVPVPQWHLIPPKDPAAIDILTAAYFEHGHSIKKILRVLFNSEFFMESMFMRVKSPAELIVGTLRSTNKYEQVDGMDTSGYQIMEESGFMGQKLLNPPSVEGWHTGKEWITSGSLIDRVNFAARHFGDDSQKGVNEMINRVKSSLGEEISENQVIDACLSAMGEIEVSEHTYKTLVEFVKADPEQVLSVKSSGNNFIKGLFQIIASSKEFQMC